MTAKIIDLQSRRPHSVASIHTKDGEPVTQDDIQELQGSLDALWENGTKERDPKDIPKSDRMLGEP